MKYFCISAILKKNRGVERLRDSREGNFAFVMVSSSGGASNVNGTKTNVKKVCARRRLDGSRCFRFGLRIYNFFGLFPTAKI